MSERGGADDLETAFSSDPLLEMKDPIEDEGAAGGCEAAGRHQNGGAHTASFHAVQYVTVEMQVCGSGGCQRVHVCCAVECSVRACVYTCVLLVGAGCE